MYGAAALPMICPRSWFSITMVNTDPVHGAGRAAGVELIALHWRSVLPALLGAQAVPATAMLAARSAVEVRMNRVCTRIDARQASRVARARETRAERSWRARFSRSHFSLNGLRPTQSLRRESRAQLLSAPASIQALIIAILVADNFWPGGIWPEFTL
jgi:hypothetical protein